MFGNLKEKLKGALKKFTHSVEDDLIENEIVETVQEPLTVDKVVSADDEEPIKEMVEEFEAQVLIEHQLEDELVDDVSAHDQDETAITPLSIKKEKSGKVIIPVSTKKEEVVTPVPVKDKKKGFFEKFASVTLGEEKFEELFWDVEVTLLENNVAVEVIERIKGDLKSALTGERMRRKSVGDVIKETLRSTLKDILSVPPIDVFERAEQKNVGGEPLVMAFIGVNGSGKTTTLAKMAHQFQKRGKSVVVAAADTFRAAAIDQLQSHTDALGIKLIKHEYGSDPAAVAFDAIRHAKAKGIDVVLIDSAGRLHSNDNLMNELKKLVRINTPDLKIFVGEAITGNDCVEQARLFDQAVGIDGIILAKADVDEKGGAAISASFMTKKPVLFLGIGQGYDDLEVFDALKVLTSLGL